MASSKKYIVFSIVFILISSSSTFITLGSHGNYLLNGEKGKPFNKMIEHQCVNSNIDNCKSHNNLIISQSEDIERWAVLIDINTYYTSFITNCADCLQHHGWKPDHIKTVHSSSYDEVHDAFHWLIDVADENDSILICSNTHGGNGYIVLEDANLYYATIDHWLDQCKTNNIFYSISACRSGSAIPILGEKGRVIVTACEENEGGSTTAFLTFLYPETNLVTTKTPFYFHAPTPNGAFARSDLDYNSNGWISAEEAFPYAKEWTEKWHNTILNPDNSIHPMIYDGHKGELDITNCTLTPSPFIPKLTGNRELSIGDMYYFYVVSADIDNEKLWYQVNWGDGIISDWIGPYKSNRIQTFSHMWGSRSSNQLKVRAKDSDNLITPWAKLEIEFLDNGLDQYQMQEDSAMLTDHRFCWAQSFVPSKEKLTRVDLKLSRFGNITSNIIVSVRNQLSGTNLTSCSLSFDTVSLNSSEWITCDVPDILVDPGKTYYLVLSTNGGYNNTESYDWCSTNNSESYPNGEIWIHWTEKNEWEPWSPSIDACFKTFFSDVSTPGINGLLAGETDKMYEYTIISEDRNNLNLSYHIDWGDGSSKEVIGPIPSGKVVFLNHEWTKSGIFSINVTAENPEGAKSESSTIKTIIFENSTFSNPLIRFFNNHPKLFRNLFNLL